MKKTVRVVLLASILLALASSASWGSLRSWYDDWRQASAVRKYVAKTWGIAEAGKLSQDAVRALLDAGYQGSSELSYFQLIGFFIKADKIYGYLDEGRHAEAVFLTTTAGVQSGLGVALGAVGLNGTAAVAQFATAPILYGLERFLADVRKNTVAKHVTAYFVLRKLGLTHAQILSGDDSEIGWSLSDDGWILDVSCNFPECRHGRVTPGGRPLDGSDSSKFYAMADALWEVEQQRTTYQAENSQAKEVVLALIAGSNCTSVSIGGPCNSGRPGLCGPGTWECLRGRVTCSPNHRRAPEVCSDGLDNDCDGVIDDRCPDGDGDGIADGRDVCPGTTIGGAVDMVNVGTLGCSCSQKTCNDGNVCTDDSCDLAKAQCVFTNNVAQCNDGNTCTLNDTCDGGACLPGLSSGCGNGTVEAQCAEECDGANDLECPGLCQANCVCGPSPECGNGLVEGVEQCDGSDDAACPGMCASDCGCRFTERVSVSSSGMQGNARSDNGAINHDGRFVVFVSLATNLVSGDTNGARDVFVRDRRDGTTERVSLDSAGVQANAASDNPRISGDGRYVVFRSTASNLVVGDTNGMEDIFVRDRLAGTTERASVSSSGDEAAHHLWGIDPPVISADGRFVAFATAVTNLVAPGNTGGVTHVFVRDRVAGITDRVSVSSLGVLNNANAQIIWGGLSADGRHVVFNSTATNLITDDTNASMDTFLRDRLAGTTERVGVSSSGVQANNGSSWAAISGDGRYVAFLSYAANLVPSDANGDSDIFVRDRMAGTVERVSLDSAENESSSGVNVSPPAIGADGRYVAFDATAGDFVGDDSNGVSDVFVRDRLAGTTERVSVSSSGVQGNGGTSSPQFSGDGRYVAVESSATNLVPGDTNGVNDVFVHRR